MHQNGTDERRPGGGRGQLGRTGEVALAAFALIYAAPLLAATALALRLEGAGPVLVARPGRDRQGRPRRAWSFRTLHAGAAAARYTPLGGFLRRSGLDALPNVIGGRAGPWRTVAAY